MAQFAFKAKKKNMKALKYLLFILIPLVLIYVLLCAIGPKNSNLTRDIDIDAPPAYAYNLINNLDNWDKWSTWITKDTTMIQNMENQRIGVGAGYSWESELNGNGSLELIESEKNQRVKSKMNFEGFDGNSYGEWKINTEGKGSNISWSMSADNEFPFLLRGIMLVNGFKGKLKSNFDESLALLKKEAENRAKGNYGGYKIKGIQMPEKHFVISRAEVPIANYQQFYAQNLGALFGKVTPTGVEMDGMPCGLFFKWDESKGTADMAAAIPVKEDLSIPGTTNYSIPAKNAINLDFYGDYKDTPSAHEAIEEFISDRGFLTDIPIIEEYVTDPGDEPDPKKWLTRITYYLADQE